MDNANLHEMAFSPGTFRQHLLVDADCGIRPLAQIIEPWQDFASLDASWMRLAGLPADNCYRRAWIERPRGHSKTTDMAVMACWALAFSGRQLAGYAAAGDKDQAALLSKAIDRLCRLNDWLADLITVQDGRIKNKHTNSNLSILASDAPSSYGLLPDFVLCDELTHWKNRELWDSLLSSAAKRSHCLLVVITNAGFRDSWQWQTREAIRNDPAWYFHRLEQPSASWITAATLAEQERLLPAIAYQRLWCNQWTLGTGDALDESDIEAALKLDGPQQAWQAGFAYVAGLDLGISRDHSALCVVGRHVGWTERKLRQPDEPSRIITAARDIFDDANELPGRATFDETEPTVHPATGRVRLCGLQTWAPPNGGKMDLEAIEETVRSVHQRFRLSAVCYDPWQAESIAQRLAKDGVPMVATAASGPNLTSIATEVLSHFRDRTIELYEHPGLLADLRALRVAEKSYGVRLESPRDKRGHGDAATALGLALHGAKQFRGPMGPPRINRPLLIA